MPDPYLEIREGRAGSSRPLHKEGRGDRSPKTIFSAVRASVWSKNKGVPGPPWGPPLDPPLLISVGSVAMTCTVHSSCAKFVKIVGISSLKLHLITLWYQVMKVMFNTVCYLSKK